MFISKIVQLFFDGATNPGNPGPSGCGVYIKIFENKVKGPKILLSEYKYYKYMGPYHTNNEAEYAALLMGLEQLNREGTIKKDDNICIYGDSQLVINQMKGIWQIKAENLMSYNKQSMKLAKNFDNIFFEHIKREFNTVADELSRISLVEKNKTIRVLL
jgi:ribonuclease HI